MTVTDPRDALEKFRFGDWSANPRADELVRDGVAIKLEPRTMRLLVTLAAAQGEVVSSDELFDRVWPGLVVTPSSLYEAIAQLRKAIGPGHVSTVARKGYRLTTPVVRAGASSQPVNDASAATPPAPASPRSVAVLPFRLRGVTAEHAFIRERLTEDLIVELSRQPSLVAVARGTMLGYADAPAPAAQVAREVGARYVVEGLIDLQGDELLVAAQVVDTRDGTQSSVDEVRLGLAEWPRMSSLVVSRLARALNFELLDQTSNDGGDRDALALATRAWVELFARTETPDTNLRALDCATRAQALDARSALASTCLAFCHWRRAQFGWSPSDDPQEPLRTAQAHAERAIELGVREPDAHYVGALVAYSLGETARAEEALRHCLRLSASHAPACGLLALIRTRRGHPEEADALCARAFALSPREPLRAVWHLARAWAALALHDPATALEASQRAMAVNPDFATCYITGAAAAQALGQHQLAQRWVGHLTKRTAFSSLHAVRHRLPAATEAAHQRQMDEVVELLRQASLPP